MGVNTKELVLLAAAYKLILTHGIHKMPTVNDLIREDDLPNWEELQEEDLTRIVQQATEKALRLMPELGGMKSKVEEFGTHLTLSLSRCTPLEREEKAKMLKEVLVDRQKEVLAELTTLEEKQQAQDFARYFGITLTLGAAEESTNKDSEIRKATLPGTRIAQELGNDFRQRSDELLAAEKEPREFRAEFGKGKMY